MSFINPLGLLGLIGVLVLILIYIIKSKYKEYKISSTYIWELSEKFLQKKSPISKLSSLLSLILQILIVITLSFALSHPIIAIPNSAKNYLFVVDTSASMHINNRIEIAKEKMREIVNESKNDSKFTIILSEEETVTLTDKLSDKNKVLQAIDTICASFLSNSLDSSINYAQDMFNQDKTLNVILFTDSRYAYTNNIEVINVENNESNISINNLKFKQIDDSINFYGTIISYNSDETVNLQLFIDDTLKAESSVEVLKNKDANYSFTIDYQDFEKAQVKITNEDSLVLDNEYIIYGNHSLDSYNVLLVSENPFYIKTLLTSISNVTLNSIDCKSYTNQTGYDLYIFDGYSPESLPEDGAIWLFNTPKNISNAGFTVQGDIKIDNGAKLSYTKNNNEIYNAITLGLSNSSISVSKFKQYSLITSYTTILYYENYPMVFAGFNVNGNRQVVFSFDLHDSNLPLLLDYILLFNNMMNFSLPAFCEQDSFMCGDEIKLNVLSNLTEIRVNTPSNKSTYLSLEESIATYKLNELGTYTIQANINNQRKTYQVFSSFNIGEQNPIVEIDSLELFGEKEDVSYDSSYDIQWILFIVLIVLCLLEWGVYVYEQRKVR